MGKLNRILAAGAASFAAFAFIPSAFAE